jgi:hypothetical protein
MHGGGLYNLNDRRPADVRLYWVGTDYARLRAAFNFFYGGPGAVDAISGGAADGKRLPL